ncbi:hypothetical protein SGI37_20395, partial [Providencia rettgeri]
PSYLTSGERLPSGDVPLTTPPNYEPQHTSAQIAKLRRTIESVKNQLQQVHEKNAITYNLRRRHDEFNLGDFVWKKTHFLSDASKEFSA